MSRTYTKQKLYKSKELFLEGLTLTNAISLLRDLAEEVPEDASIEYNYAEDYCEINLCWSEFETDEAFEARVKASREAEKRYEEAQYKSYLELKKKFENPDLGKFL